MKIQMRLMTTVTALLFAAVAIVSVTLILYVASTTKESAFLSQERLAAEQIQITKGRYENYLQNIVAMASLMADYDKAILGIQRRRFEDLVESLMLSNNQITDVFIVFKPDTIDQGMDTEFAGVVGNTETGQWAASFTQQNGVITHLTYNDVPGMMAIINGPDSRKQMLEEPVSQVIGGKTTYTVRFTVPVIYRQTNQVVGRIGMNIDTALSQAEVESIIGNPDIPDIVTMTLYSDKGMIIASDNPDYVGKYLSVAQASFFGEKTAEAEHAVTIGQKSRYSSYAARFDQNLEVILYPFSIGETGVSWSVLLGTGEKTLMAGVNTMISFSIVIAVVFLVVAPISVLFITRQITKPIVTIALTLKDIAEGEGDLTKTININSKDEIGDMARYFNATLEKIRKVVITIKNQSASLSHIGSDLASNMSETAVAINEIATNIRSIKGRITNQSASVTETNSVMEQISAHINTLSSHVLRQGDCVVRSSSAIEQMIANIQSVTQTLIKNGESVKDLLEASEVGRTGLEDVVEDIQRIAQESEGLLEINAVIQNIASQTNLLSMNAAIEAAHAGDVGKGFAVVAEEIRKLAESADEQSKTIATVLNKIKKSIDTITTSTDSVLHKFQTIDSDVRIVSSQVQNIRASMEEQNAGSKQVLDDMGQLSDVTALVKNTSIEMLEGSKQVIVESHNLDQATQEISNGMNEMATGADQINEAVVRVNTISNDNKENIDVLVNEVSKFKVE
ncbi:MAG: methyl-accepting chemotaxis protein [Treponema sp.]|jgi:methyl-accepting chemotaxis protein|nr:methyl-accepting chemotaxis protein [Treponema sp.]